MESNAEAMRDIRRRLWDSFRCVDDTVYHYTDQVGLLGILRDRAVRAHSTRYLNDPTEGERARSIWCEALEDYPEVRDLLKDMWKGMGFESFCASFSFESDLLSQWRGYADSGAGFAIGFHPRGFHPKRRTYYGRVLYSADEERELIERTLEEHMPLLESEIGALDLDPDDEENAAKRLPPAFVSMATCFLVYDWIMKDAAYSEEREYRQVYLVPGPRLKDASIEFGASARGIRPYVEMPFWNGDDQHFVKEIVVGPLLPFEDTRRTLEMFLSKEGYRGVEIRPSRVPHRR